MIKLWGTTDTTFDTNGDLTIQPLRAVVRNEDSTAFYLDLETDLSYVDELTEGRILTADLPGGAQPFRIQNVTKSRKKITIRANHVFFDSKNYLIQDSYVVNRNANDALDHLNSATEPESEFTTISDIQNFASYRCVRTSLFDAVKEVQARWGGHIVMDGFTIGLRDSIGADRGMTVQYAKNLQNIEAVYNWDNVVTKLLPVGYDGLTLDEVYLDADITYDQPYTKTVTFQQDISSDDYPTEAAYLEALETDLRLQAEAYLEIHKYPEVTYTLSAYVRDQIELGDVVRVTDSRLGIDLNTNVIAYTYNCITERYTETVFGNFQPSLQGLMGTITATATQAAEEAAAVVRVTLGAELDEATAAIWANMNDSYVIYEGDRILVVDTLPKEDATNVIMINSAGIGFSNTGIDGTFNSAWLIDGTMDMQNINVINLTADLIKGGTLKLGSMLNESGVLELYDADNNLIGLMDNNGLKMYGLDGSYVLMNADVGFAGYDSGGTKVFWADEDEFHMKKSVVEEEITLCERARFIPITIMSGSTTVNDGIGLIAVSQS